MEEQRIGAMYVNMVKRWATNTWDALFPKGLLRSRLFPMLLIGAVVVLPAAAWYLHIYGRFHLVKKQIGAVEAPPPATGPQPGGYDPLVLRRPDPLTTNIPEFRSATLLPGLGMDVLQITANIPNRGEIPLLFAPSLAEVADAAGPRAGINDNHGGLEVPWGGMVSGLISPTGSSVTSNWKGHVLNLTRDVSERAGVAEGGLLETQGVDGSQTEAQAMGVKATGEFKNTDFGGHWVSRTTVDVSAVLGAHSFDLTVTARNVGDEPEPMGIGWHPRFAIPSGDRNNVELRLPTGERLEIGDKTKGLPSGKIVPAGDALGRFILHAAPLGPLNLNEMEVNLHAGVMEAGPTAEFRDPDAGFGLRMTAMSPAVRALRVTAPTGASYVSLGMQTNYDDPLGKEWTDASDPAIMVIEPGESVEWKIRLEIFPILKH